MPFCTDPKSKGEGAMVRNGAATVLEAIKSAFTIWEAPIVMVHVPVPLHAPDQPLKANPIPGTAFNVTDVP